MTAIHESSEAARCRGRRDVSASGVPRGHRPLPPPASTVVTSVRALTASRSAPPPTRSPRSRSTPLRLGLLRPAQRRPSRPIRGHRAVRGRRARATGSQPPVRQLRPGAEPRPAAWDGYRHQPPGRPGSPAARRTCSPSSSAPSSTCPARRRPSKSSSAASGTSRPPLADPLVFFRSRLCLAGLVAGGRAGSWLGPTPRRAARPGAWRNSIAPSATPKLLAHRPSPVRVGRKRSMAR